MVDSELEVFQQNLLSTEDVQRAVHFLMDFIFSRLDGVVMLNRRETWKKYRFGLRMVKI